MTTRSKLALALTCATFACKPAGWADKAEWMAKGGFDAGTRATAPAKH